jgi:acetolactate synthase I/II/III large subunit
LSEVDRDYRPQVDLTGDIAATLQALSVQVKPRRLTSETAFLKEISRERSEFAKMAADLNGAPAHPLRIVFELQKLMSNDVTLCSDMGSFHIWLARYFYSFRARQILIADGEQTLGVVLPWRSRPASSARSNRWSRSLATEDSCFRRWSSRPRSG